MTGKQLAAKAAEIANHTKTLYVLGCFGAPLNHANKKRYTSNYAYNATSARKRKIEAACASGGIFGFDCMCLIKAILWGWKGDKNAVYGGAVYEANGVPDIGADETIRRCREVSTDFSRIDFGEAVWMPGHIGIYLGDGLAVECTPIWKDGVQITAVNRDVAGYNRRNWTKHGKLPWVDYTEETRTAEDGTYTVRAGDCLTAIAEAFGVTVEALVRWNGISDPDVIRVGQILRVEPLPGDVNGDGMITAYDARTILRASVGLENLTEDQRKAADLDGDGEITANDAREALRRSVGKGGDAK